MTITTREPIRSPMKEPIRDQKRLTRQYHEDDDKFKIDPSLIPEGMSWEWKRNEVYGKEDPNYLFRLSRNGWTPVDASKVPGFAAPGKTGALHFEGMVLMERPQYLTDEAKAEDLQRARDRVTDNQRQLLGERPADEAPRQLAKINRTIERGRVVAAQGMEVEE